MNLREPLNKIKELSLFDKLLSVYIIIAMVSGTLFGVYTSLPSLLEKSKILNVSTPVFIGLLFMLYPVFCKVQYENLSFLISSNSRNSTKLISTSLVLNWILCPLLMAAFAWISLPDLEEYRQGVLLIGIARCIAMVMIWNEIAGGNNDWCAIFVSINSILQMLLFSPLAYFYIVLLGNGTSSIEVWLVVKNVLIFLGIPFFCGLLTRIVFRRLLKRWFDKVFCNWVGLLALLGLLYTIFLMFALQGLQIIAQIGSVLRVSIPLLLYFPIVWFSVMVHIY